MDEKQDCIRAGKRWQERPVNGIGYVFESKPLSENGRKEEEGGGRFISMGMNKSENEQEKWVE